MAWSRVALVSTFVVLSALSIPGQAQPAPEFLLLGTDPTGDPSTNGAPVPDTWIDINSLSVATIGTDLVFHLGLQGTTTEAGSYCWMAAFEFGGTEYVGLDCYEAVAGVNNNAASTARPATTSRGTNVASSVVFDDAGAVITIPLAAIGAAPGDVIEDVYGLTYVTRALNVVDVVPDAKRTATSDESLGSYCIGGCAAGAVATGNQTLHETLNGTKLRHEFGNATNATYIVNATVSWANVTVTFGATVLAGSANVTILRGNETLATFSTADQEASDPANATAGASASVTATSSTTATSTNGTIPGNNGTRDGDNRTGRSTTVRDAAGNWTLRIVYSGFQGSLSIDLAEAKPPMASATTTTTAGNTTVTGGEDEESTPGLALPLLAGVVALVAVLRRRR